MSATGNIIVYSIIIRLFCGPYQQMVMEDPEPWIKIPGPYKNLSTESGKGNGM